jgi:acyl-CoA thioester hydrolase
MRVELPFEITLRTYFEDTDMAGVVYYANYLKFFERGRTEYLRQLGLENRHAKAVDGGVFVVAQCQIKYLKPALMDDLLTVRIDQVLSGRASATFTQSIWRTVDTNPQNLCNAVVKVGYVDSVHFRPKLIPEDIFS